MRTKKKLLGTLAGWVISLMFIASWTVLGVVLALQEGSVNLGGSIEFIAKDIYADITGRVTGTKEPVTLDDIHFSAENLEFETPTSWSNMDLTFDEDATPIEIQVTINNKSTHPLYVDFTEGTDYQNVTVTRKKGADEVAKFNSFEISGGTADKPTSQTLDITFKVTDMNNDSKGNLSLVIKLSSIDPNAAQEESELNAQGIYFNSYDTSAKTVALSMATNPAEGGDFVCPRYVMKDGVKYKVTQIGTPVSSTSNASLQEQINTVGKEMSKVTKIIQAYANESLLDMLDRKIGELEASFDKMQPEIEGIINQLKKYRGYDRVVIRGYENVFIPDTVTHIYGPALADESIKTVTFPDSIQVLGGDDECNMYGVFSYYDRRGEYRPLDLVPPESENLLERLVIRVEDLKVRSDRISLMLEWIDGQSKDIMTNSNVTHVYFPKKLKTSDVNFYGTFFKCTSLQKVVLPEGIIEHSIYKKSALDPNNTTSTTQSESNTIGTLYQVNPVVSVNEPLIDALNQQVGHLEVANDNYRTRLDNIIFSYKNTGWYNPSYF